MYDLLIVSGRVPDFEHNVWRKGPVAVQDGKIVAVGDEVRSTEARTVIDAAGKIVSPGFIDIHMHEEDFLNDGAHFEISVLMRNMGVTTAVGGNCGTHAQPIKAFREAAERLGGLPIHYYMLTGYNTFREELGLGCYDTATEDQIKHMTNRVIQEIRDGAKGVSFGGEYDPGISSEEILRVLAALDDQILVSMHYRTDAMKDFSALHEMIELAERSGKKFQISHLSSYGAMGQMKEILPILNEAIRKNPRLDYDTYPYAAFATSIGSAVFDEGWVERWGKGYECIMLLHEPYCGVRCDRELFEKVRKEKPDMSVAGFVMEEEDIAMAIANRYGMICSDGGTSHWKGHPRSSGTFPRVLGKYVREENVLSLMDALRKMTFRPAQRLGLERRKGVIASGADADIVIFDPDIISDTSDFSEACRMPVGIDFVIVGGTVVLKNGKETGALPGQLL